jgi:hypothetical protein
MALTSFNKLNIIVVIKPMWDSAVRNMCWTDERVATGQLSDHLKGAAGSQSHTTCDQVHFQMAAT